MTSAKKNNGFLNWIKESLGLRIFVMGVLALLLLIPLQFVKHLFQERENLQNSSINEVSEKWGNEQVILGPVLKIPYLQQVQVFSEDGKSFQWDTQKEEFYLLPNQLDITAKINTEVRYRGVYEIIVYKTQIHLEGNFEEYGDIELWKQWNIDPDQILWENATVEFSVGDPKGINSEVSMDWEGNSIDFSQGEIQSSLHQFTKGYNDYYYNENSPSESNYISSAVVLPLEGGLPRKNHFKMDIDLKGSKRLHFVPIGKTTTASLSSSWSSPSFDGDFLPEKRTIDASGFNASWKIIHLNRGFPQQFRSPLSVKNTSFGLTLYQPGNIYQMTNRAGKYGFMIIALTLLAFFFFQLFYPVRVHPFQLFLIGLALCIFYALLIAISEHILFTKSYLISSVATISLIVSFTWSIVKRFRIALQLGGLLILLYGVIYWLIQLEDPLLAGTLILFGILATLMTLSSKINWYKNSINSKP